ncbi:MAG: leucyl/phenylalanyl-tRNA--protein transferase [Chitinophagales bacterium]|nr:leucyl/phenylalanyl-tRNA--protein transferase [Chitinophagales bacterium]
MALWVLDKELAFPPVSSSQPDGLLAIGGDLSPERLLLAYRKGIFPWYEGDYILWWCPNPRFVLFPAELKINRSSRQLLKKNEMMSRDKKWEFTINKAFKKVIRNCKKTYRPGQSGTWITDEMELAYTRMHELGYACSAETWQGGKLVGGLYGIKLGKVFFGESMFSRISNASRYALINYTRLLSSEGIELIDCQVYTEYLESFGARMIPRNEFCKKLEALIT